jgi:hypothetical protein
MQPWPQSPSAASGSRPCSQLQALSAAKAVMYFIGGAGHACGQP